MQRFTSQRLILRWRIHVLLYSWCQQPPLGILVDTFAVFVLKLNSVIAFTQRPRRGKGDGIAYEHSQTHLSHCLLTMVPLSTIPNCFLYCFVCAGSLYVLSDVFCAEKFICAICLSILWFSPEIIMNIANSDNICRVSIALFESAKVETKVEMVVIYLFHLILSVFLCVCFFCLFFLQLKLVNRFVITAKLWACLRKGQCDWEG